MFLVLVNTVDSLIVANLDLCACLYIRKFSMSDMRGHLIRECHVLAFCSHLQMLHFATLFYKLKDTCQNTVKDSQKLRNLQHYQATDWTYCTSMSDKSYSITTPYWWSTESHSWFSPCSFFLNSSLMFCTKAHVILS